MTISIHLDYILGTLPLAERFVAARKLGFDAVEFPFPYAVPAEEYVSLLADNGLRQISIGAPACNYKAGEPGFSLTPSLKGEFDRSIDTVIGYAKTIDCPNVHLFAGPKADDVSEELAFTTYCDNLREGAARLRVEGLRVVIEAVNSTDFPGYFMNRLDRVIKAIEQIGDDDTGIILDIYHANVNAEDPIAFLRAHSDRVAHIQLADFPGRHEPGTGGIDFGAFFAALDEIHYARSIGLEYVPTRPVFEGVPLAEHLFTSIH
ncbi:TIM barrel protein [Sphingomonas sp. AP4-R1]|uniref:hydroxypyruvate isomerase family protein n=1 Tax=Sphingomonas sp. AP4-R1 TaxID=2735134 RepID=UPI001493B0B6|nr:TIM barrel protein [Sphingomonas sp. AP4-R1]QJU58163.1 TIM barrel protein [Sphingomonas sp. AP4-R1]